MAFYLDDIPADAFVIELPQDISVDLFTDAEARLIDPDGEETILDAEIDEDGSVIAGPPDESPFIVEGVYKLRAALTSATARQGLPDMLLVAQDPDSQWHTLDSIRAEWPDAEAIPDASLWALLTVSKVQVVAYAPVLAEDVPVPSHYRDAQRIQARNVWTASKVAPDGGIGADDFVIRPFPLDWHVKQILRPKHGIPVVA